MGTATKQSPPIPRTTDRLMEALSTLAALLDRTINEVKSLDGEYQTRLTDAVKKTEESLKTQSVKHVEDAREEVREDLTRRFQSDLQSALDSLRADFQVERERLTSEFNGERERLNQELRHSADSLSELQVERSKLAAELQHAREDAAAEIERARTEMQTAVEAASKVAVGRMEAPDSEIQRVENDLEEIVRVIDNPETDLSVVIRKNVEKVELAAYLRGLRFSKEKSG